MPCRIGLPMKHTGECKHLEPGNCRHEENSRPSADLMSNAAQLQHERWRAQSWSGRPWQLQLGQQSQQAWQRLQRRCLNRPCSFCVPAKHARVRIGTSILHEPSSMGLANQQIVICLREHKWQQQYRMCLRIVVVCLRLQRDQALNPLQNC